MGVASVHHTSSLGLFPTQEEGSSHSSTAPEGSHSPGRQTVMNLPSMNPSQTVPGCVPSTASQVLPASLLQRALLLPWSPHPVGVLLAHRRLTGSQPPLGIHLLQCGVFHRLQVDLCSTVSLPGYRETGCLTIVFPVGCWGVFAAAPKAPSPLPSSLNLLSAALFLPHILTPFSVCCCTVGFFLCFLNI